MLEDIITAIKNLDIKRLNVLLDDDKSFMDVTKATFIKKLDKQFKKLKDNGCQSFDDVFFGICEHCNKGCEGMTFLSEAGYYLDIYIESENDESVNDIYVCNKLTNIVGLDKTLNLGFSFYKDEKIGFRPHSEYNSIKQHYKALLFDLNTMNEVIHLDDFIKWYDGFKEFRISIFRLGLFAAFDYKLYSDVFKVTSQIGSIIDIESKADDATDGLIDYYLAKSEREKLIWFYNNQTNHRVTIHFDLQENWRETVQIIFKTENIQFCVDVSGYEYILEYFEKLNDFHDELMDKYKPLPEHYEQSSDGYVLCTLENYLRLHNQHLDIVEKLSSKT
jgi:hypothetical protein